LSGSPLRRLTLALSRRRSDVRGGSEGRAGRLQRVVSDGGRDALEENHKTARRSALCTSCGNSNGMKNFSGYR
jgi:hypothetical protein